MKSPAVVGVAVFSLLAAYLHAEQPAGAMAVTRSANHQTEATASAFKPRPQWLPLKVLGVFERTMEPVVLYERPEEIGSASYIRSGSGKTETLAVDALMNQADTILVGKDHQVFGRFGDGTAVYLAPFSVMEMTERQQTGDRTLSTLLSLFQGALRVNVPKGAAQGSFVVRLPNVKEGPIDIAGVGTHFFIYPRPELLDMEWRSIVMDISVFSGTADVKLPMAKTATGDVGVTLNQATTVALQTGEGLRIKFRFEPLEEPKYGGPVYMLFIDVVEKITFPPPRIVTPWTPPPPVPPSGGG